MKVKFKYGIRTYSGTLDEMVYGSYRKHKLCIGREYVYPTLTDNNELLGSVGKNLSELYWASSEGYRADLKTYAQRNCSENVPKTQLCPTSYAIFIKLMYAWQDDDPEHVDLATVTSDDVDSLGTKIATIKDAIDYGLLKGISEYSDLSNSF